MASLNDLNSRFTTDGVSFDEGFGGLPRVTVRNAACEADIYLHGAHVTHFQPAGHKPLLFVSGQSEFAPEKPIRGGVPVIFPWFGPREGSGLHGIVRLMEWDVENVRSQGENVTINFLFTADAATHDAWPGGCAVRYEVTVGATLKMALRVENLDVKPIRYEEALHTYFAVGDVRQMDISGLHDTPFIDKTDNFAEKTQLERQLRLSAETDRVYLNTEDTCTIHDEANARRILVEKHGSRATVVWNPWTAKAAAMPDFGDDEWPYMVCIEACNVGGFATELDAGATHEMVQHISVENV